MSKSSFGFRKTYGRTPAYTAAVRALEAIPFEDRVFAYGEATAEEAGERWAGGELTRSKARLQFWGALIGKRPKTPGIVLAEETLPADDHTSLWTKEGKPHVYVSQPYQLNHDDIRKILAACDEHGLTVRVSSEPSWHHPGRVLTLEYRRKQPK